MAKRTVILPSGRPISQVPEDVTDEDVAKMYGETFEAPEQEPVEVAPEPTPEPEEDKGFIESAKDVAFDFRKVLARTQASLIGTGVDVISGLLPSEEREIVQRMSGDIGTSLATQAAPELVDPETGRVAATETIPGMIAEVAPYVVVGSRIQGARAIQQTPRLVQGLLTGVATDQLLADEDENIFNVIQDVLPESAVADYTAFLAAKDNDPEIIKRLKLVGEGLGLGVLMEVVGGSVKLAAKSRQLFNKSYTDLTPKEQGEIFEAHLKESRNKVQLSKPEQKVEFNETPEGAAQVRQQQSSRLNRFFRQLFTTRGYFTNNAQSAFDNAEYAQRAAVSRAEHIATRLTKAMDEIVESSDQNISEQVQDALTSERLSNLLQSDRSTVLLDIQEEFGFTPEIAEEVLNARELIDGLSKEITGSSNLGLNIREIVNENIGSYMRRSYRLFEDTGYKPSEDAVSDAREYLAELRMNQNPDLSEELAYQQADDTIKQILDQGGVADRTAAGDYYAKVKRINKEILTGREEISPEIRALMGEIENPADNIVLTVSKMSRLVETSKFYNTLDRLGTQGRYIFDKDTVRPEGFVEISGTNSALDGKYTTPEILSAIKKQESDNLLKPEGEGFLASAYRNFLSLKGSSQAAKTVFSITTHARNFLGAMQFGMANGLNPIKNFGATGAVLKNQILKAGNESLDEAYEKYQRLGIINTNVKVNEFRDLMESDYDVLMDPNKLVNKLGSFGRVINGVEDLYVATDDMFKVNAYHQELDELRKAFPDADIATLEEEAANIIRNTFPNYDRVPKGIKALRNMPVGSFVSFPAEVIRTSAHIIRQASREIMSGSDVLRSRGRARLAGFATTNSMWGAAGYATAKLAGLSEEERQAAEKLTETPWSKDSPKLFLKINDKLFTADTQFLDSYSVIKEPFLAAYREISEGRLEGERLDRYLADAALTATGTLMRPFADETILTQALTDVGFAAKDAGGRTPAGERLFTEGMSTIEKIGAVGYHVFDSFVPGAATQAKNIAESIADVPNRTTGKYRYTPAELAATFLGVRFSEINPDDALRFAVSDYNFDNQNAVTTSPNFRTKGSKIVGTYEARQNVRYRNAQELDKKIRASIELIGAGETARYLQKAGMSGATLGQFMAGRYMPEQISTDLILNILEKTPLSEGETHSGVVRDLIRKYSSMVGTRLQEPAEDSPLRRTLFNIGGEVYDVPQAPVEPDERIDRMTGLPYNLQAGGAFIDEEEREGFSGGGKVIVRLLADVIQKYSKKNVSEDAAISAADRIVSAVDQNAEFMPELSTANPKYAEFLETNTRALLDEKHTPIPEEITTQAGEGGQEFSRLRGYTDEEFEVFRRSNQIADELKEETGQDLMDETFLITNELDNIRARDMDYGDLDEGMSVENQIADIELEYEEILSAARAAGDTEAIEELTAERNRRIGDILEDIDREDFAEGGVLERAIKFALGRGAKALGFDAEQQRQHEKEVVALVNEAAEKGFIPEQSRIPTDEAGFGKFSGADEEVFNAFNHAYLVYKHGSKLKDPLLQGKEYLQMTYYPNPDTERVDLINNAFGSRLRDVATDDADAKQKIVLGYYNTQRKLAEGKPLVYGEDLIFNINDLENMEPRSARFRPR